ncbi:NPCBM-associated, NEW3 domain-containing alpha-galactosidase [Paenibacillus sp. 32O-W]|uniref:COG1470 family protein n=1 Tax=Paenibacillus sp. 32O-W TaxID=1695218 RepID=UPI000722AD6C|nr:NEW3 domain-containing protein [Paenibacillus sp. 32O-W]ALS28263.1 NPCBM-associated, NEW3 domain-containing alpha-galactosidase [Paenibacillus sp. 32O-W]
MRAACRRTIVSLVLAIILGLGGTAAGFTGSVVSAASAVELYTPYLRLSAPPGESITYSIDVINHGSSTATVDLGFKAQSADWEYEMTAGGRNVSRLAVKAGESQSVSLTLHVPLEVEKGVYQFEVSASGSVLPLAVEVSEKGTFRTELETDQPNIQGHADSTFSFTATLRNRTAESQTYALSAAADPGWNVTFSSGGNNVSSLEVEPNAEKSVTINVEPPDTVKAGTYEIPIKATTNSTSAETKVEVDITGTYGISVSTADERLNAKVTAGASSKVDLVVTNSGSAELKNVNMSASSPTGWEVSFDKPTVESIKPGESARVQATIKASKEALPGDYVVSITASSAEKSADAQIRVAVKSSVLWGWIGILIILAVAGGIYYLFRKYGRR